jgi:glycosyltransferase involved in cell wall biosynthesis
LTVSNIHIALLFEYSSLNGGERSMLAVMDVLRASERQRPQTGSTFQFTAIAPDDGPLAKALREREIDVQSFPFHDAAGQRRPAEDVATDLEELVARIQPDILHANSLAMSRLTGQVSERLTCTVTGHLRDIMKISKAAMTDLNRNRALAAVSDATRDFHTGRGMAADRVTTVYNGVNDRDFQPRPRTGQLHHELQLQKNAFLVLSVGQIGLRKAVDVLAQAAIDACQKSPRIHFVVVGERNSTKQESIDFETGVDRQLADAGLASHWHRLGRRTDVAMLMNESDVLVHVAHQEPLGRVLLEAAGAGLPIIATEVGGTAEIVTDGVSARLVPPADALATSAAIRELQADLQLRNRLAVAARVEIETRFTDRIAAQALAEFWQAAAAR